MSDRRGRTALRRLGMAVLFLVLTVLVWRLSDFGSQPKASQYFWIAVFSLSGFAVLMFLLVAVPARRARQAAEAVRSTRPGAVVVNTSWDGLHTEYFLKRGPLTRKANGRVGYLLLVADQGGIELIRPQGLFSFGLIPWALVEEIRLDVLVAPLASRPKLVIAIQGGSTPYSDIFELLPEGKAERASAAETLAEILSMRPVGRR